MLPKTSADAVRSAQNLDDKLQPVIQYVKDGTLPNNAAAADKILKQEGQYFLSEDDILYGQSSVSKIAVIQQVVPKALQMELLQWCHDHFASGCLGLPKTYERLRLIYFWNNMFVDLQR